MAVTNNVKRNEIIFCQVVQAILRSCGIVILCQNRTLSVCWLCDRQYYWPKECVVSWELLKLAVCQRAQGVLGESARLQELTSVFRCRSCFFLGVLDVTCGNDNVGGSRFSSTAQAAKPKSGGTLH